MHKGYNLNKTINLYYNIQTTYFFFYIIYLFKHNYNILESTPNQLNYKNYILKSVIAKMYLKKVH